MESKPQTCEIFQDQIDEMSQGELRETRKFDLLAGHLAQCPGCQAYWQDTLALADRLDQWQMPEPRKNIAAAVMAEIAQLEHDQRSSNGFWHRSMQQRLHIPVPVAAIVLLALILSVAFNLRPSPPIARVTPVAIDHSPIDQPRLRPVNMTDTVAPGLPGFWTVPAMTPGTYVIILGAPPMVANGGLFVPQKPKPNHAL